MTEALSHALSHALVQPQTSPLSLPCFSTDRMIFLAEEVKIEEHREGAGRSFLISSHSFNLCI